MFNKVQTDGYKRTDGRVLMILLTKVLRSHYLEAARNSADGEGCFGRSRNRETTFGQSSERKLSSGQACQRERTLRLSIDVEPSFDPVVEPESDLGYASDIEISFWYSCNQESKTSWLYRLFDH